METKTFTIAVSDWHKVSTNCAQLIFSEAKSYLEYLNMVCDKITARAFSIFTLLMPITSALIVFLVNQIMRSAGKFQFLTLFTVAIISALIVIMFQLGILIRGRGFMSLGHAPKDLCTDKFLGVTMQEDDSLKALLLGAIESYQKKISFNETQNSARIQSLNFCIKEIGLLLVSSALAAIIYFFIA